MILQGLYFAVFRLLAHLGSLERRKAWAQQQNFRRVEAYRPYIGPRLDEGLEQVKRKL